MSAVRARVASPGVAAAPARSLAAVGSGTLALVRDPLRLALFILTVITISRVHQHYPVLEKFRPAMLLVVAAVGYAYLHPRYLTRRNVFSAWADAFRCRARNPRLLLRPFGISLGGSALSSRILHQDADLRVADCYSIRHVRDLYTFVGVRVELQQHPFISSLSSFSGSRKAAVTSLVEQPLHLRLERPWSRDAGRSPAHSAFTHHRAGHKRVDPPGNAGAYCGDDGALRLSRWIPRFLWLSE